MRMYSKTKQQQPTAERVRFNNMKTTSISIERNKETNKWELLSSGTTIPLGEELGAFALNKLVIMMGTAKADFYADAEMMGFIEKQIEFLRSFKLQNEKVKSA